MNNWFSFAIITIFLWGIWAFFSKLATGYINPKNVMIWQTIGVLMAVFYFLISTNFKTEINSRGIILSILVGLLGTVAMLFFLAALSKGKASVVVTMTSLYPLVTILLSFLILKEAINIRQGIGIILALGAMVLFAK